MSQTPLVERHRVLGVLLTLGVLVVVGWVSGQVIGTVLVQLVRLGLGAVTGDG